MKINTVSPAVVSPGSDVVVSYAQIATIPLSIAGITAVLLAILTLIFFLSPYHIKWKIRRYINALSNAITRFWSRNGHDLITGLPNRNSFIRHLSDETNTVATRNTKLGLLYFRILNFPEINMLAGYAIGDKLLRTIGDNLVTKFGCEVASLSPGTFVVVLKPVRDEDDAYQIAYRLLESIQAPVMIDKISLEPRCTSGLSLFPDHATDSLQLLRNAELASSAGLELRRQIIIYSPEYEPDSRQLNLMSDFSNALSRKEFHILCQPKINVQNREIIGGEILIRWQHPDFGKILPDDFIPLAEKTGFIKRITLYVLREVISYIETNIDAIGHLQFSVNVAAKDISDPDFGSRVADIVHEHASRLLLEITETDAMHDRRQVLKTAGELHKSGISLSIDDFGTGYSSLSYLKELNPEELKIDKLFIRDLLRSKNDMSLVRSTIQLAHELGISVVAEGVEDDRTLEALADLKCDKAQGFGISRPMPLEDFAAWCQGSVQSQSGGRFIMD